MSTAGHDRRLSRLFNAASGRSVIVPVDDSLIAGPVNGLHDLDAKLTRIVDAQPEAILGFAGQFEHLRPAPEVGWICNLTASTVRSNHTRKVQVGTVRDALSIGADAVAAHVNTTSGYESEMLATLGAVISEARPLGVPVVAIMYPRREHPDGSDDNYDSLRHEGEQQFVEVVSHAVRIARELGASLIKTQFTGSTDSFRQVVAAASPVHVIIAGGPIRPVREALAMADAAVAAGAAGVSLGRNVYGRDDVGQMVRALLGVVHERLSVDEAIRASGG